MLTWTACPPDSFKPIRPFRNSMICSPNKSTVPLLRSEESFSSSMALKLPRSTSNRASGSTK